MPRRACRAISLCVAGVGHAHPFALFPYYPHTPMTLTPLCPCSDADSDHQPVSVQPSVLVGCLRPPLLPALPELLQRLPAELPVPAQRLQGQLPAGLRLQQLPAI